MASAITDGKYTKAAVAVGQQEWVELLFCSAHYINITVD